MVFPRGKTPKLMCSYFRRCWVLSVSQSLPTNADASLRASLIYRMKKMKILVVHYYATLIGEWSLETWYIATCEGKNNGGTYKVDHLIRIRDRNNLKWKHQPKRNLMNLHVNSTLDCKLKGNEIFLMKDLFTEKPHTN